MKTKNIFFLWGLVLFLANCSEEKIDDVQFGMSAKSTSNVVTQDEAINKAENFLCSYTEKTRGVRVNAAVSTIYPLRKSFFYDITKGGIDHSCLPDTLAYIVNFSDAEGFAIVSADNRLEDILAYVDNGSLSPTDNVEGMGIDYFFHQLPYYINFVISQDNSMMNSPRGDLGPGGGGLGPGGGGLEGPTTIDTLVRPLLNTKWGQGAPFNMLCPIRGGNHAPAGCMAISLAQIMAYHKWPISCEGVEFEWDEMQTDSAVPSAGTAQYYVAELIAHTGPHLNMDYQPDVATSHTPDVGLCLDTMQYCHSGYLPYDFSQVMDDVYSEFPVHIDGADYSNPDTTYAHAWVIDGAMVRSVHLMDYQYGVLVVVGRMNISRYVHCNWGSNGSFNGYFLSGVFDPNQRKYLSNVTRANYSTLNAVYYDIHPNIRE